MDCFYSIRYAALLRRRVCGGSEVKVIGLIKKLYVYTRGKVFHNGMSRRIVAAAALLSLKLRKLSDAHSARLRQYKETKKKSRPNECNPS